MPNWFFYVIAHLIADVLVPWLMRVAAPPDVVLERAGRFTTRLRAPSIMMSTVAALGLCTSASLLATDVHSKVIWIAMGVSSPLFFWVYDRHRVITERVGQVFAIVGYVSVIVALGIVAALQLVPIPQGHLFGMMWAAFVGLLITSSWNRLSTRILPNPKLSQVLVGSAFVTSALAGWWLISGDPSVGIGLLLALAGLGAMAIIL